MAIEYKTVTYRTVESTNDMATFSWCELSTTHSPLVAGTLKRISIECRTSGGEAITIEPCYLGVWEHQDNGELVRVGVSKNKVAQIFETAIVYEFENTYLTGRTLVLGILAEQDGNWADTVDCGLGARVANSDRDGCYTYHKTIGKRYCVPDITFTIDYPEVIPDDEPEPEPEVEEHRIVDISKYWIQIIRNTNEFKQIAIAENPEFNGLLDAIYRALKDGFIIEATDYGVSRWEKILKLVVTEGMTLEDRKVQILNYLSVKLPYTWRVLKQMLTEYLGDGNFNMSIDNDTETFTLSLTAGAMSKTDEIDQLLKRVLPENLVIKYDDMPIDYTLLDYLESSGTQYIDTGIVPQTNTRLFIEAEIVAVRSGLNSLFGVRNEVGTTRYYYDAYYSDEQSIGLRAYHRTTGASVAFPTGRFTAEYTGSEIRLNGKSVLTYKPQELTFDTANKLLLYAMNYNNNVSQQSVVKIYRFRLENDKETLIDFVPVLDETGTPCMYDTVTHECFPNDGSGKFGYRVKVTGIVVMPLDLDDPYYIAPSGVWAKLIDENTLDIITALDPTVDE